MIFCSQCSEFIRSEGFCPNCRTEAYKTGGLQWNGPPTRRLSTAVTRVNKDRHFDYAPNRPVPYDKNAYQNVSIPKSGFYSQAEYVASGQLPGMRTEIHSIEVTGQVAKVEVESNNKLRLYGTLLVLGVLQFGTDLDVYGLLISGISVVFSAGFFLIQLLVTVIFSFFQFLATIVSASG